MTIVLLSTSFVNAEPTITNDCGSNHDSFVQEYKVGLESYLGVLKSKNPLPNDALKAALYYLNRNEQKDFESATKILKELLEDQTNTIDGKDFLYYLWIKNKYPDSLEGIAPTATINPINDPDGFLSLIPNYLSAGTNKNEILQKLSDNALNKNWLAENDPEDLENLVLGLLMLYDLSPTNDETDKLIGMRAEMTLDYLFTIQAATTINGEYEIPSVNSETEYAYPVNDNDFKSWNTLLLEIPDSGVLPTEPGILIAGYCAHAKTKQLFRDKNVVLKTTMGGVNHPVVNLNNENNFLISSFQKTSSDNLGGRPVSARFYYLGNSFDENAYMNFWSRTKPSSEQVVDKTHSSFQYSGGQGTVLMGELTGDDCEEPNIYLGQSTDLKVNILATPEGEYAALLVYGGDSSNPVYLGLRFNNKMLLESIKARYKPLSKETPTTMFNDLFTYGGVIFPNETTNTSYVLEVLPSSWYQPILDDLEDSTITNQFSEGCDNSADACFENANRKYLLSKYLKDSSLTFDTDKIVYDSNITGENHEFKLLFDQSFLVDSVAQTSGDDDSIIRKISSGSTNYLIQDGSAINIYPGQGAVTLKLNFTTTVVEDTKSGNGISGEGISGTSQDQDSTNIDYTINPNQKLSFISNGFINALSSDYTITCSDINDLLPNIDFQGLVTQGCIINNLNNHKTTLALVYDNEETNVQSKILLLAANFFPAKKWDSSGTIIDNDAVSFDENMCSEITSQDNSFTECGTIFTSSQTNKDDINVWVNELNSIIIFSEDEDPLTSGWADGFTDFISGLFSNGELSFEPGELSSFDRAYFNKISVGGVDKSLSVVKNPLDQYKLLFDNVAFDASKINGNSMIGDNKQLVTTTDASLWSSIKSFRLSSKGDGSDYNAVCGNNIKELGEECDTNQGVVCENNHDFTKTCNSNCEWDDSDCEQCVDLDNDGYLDNSCTDIPDGKKGGDWLDAVPSSKTSATGFNCSFVEGEDCSTNFSNDGVKINPPQDNYKYAGCPQCVYPGAPEYCDRIPNSNPYHEIGCIYDEDVVDTSSFDCPENDGSTCDFICGAVSHSERTPVETCTPNTQVGCVEGYCLDSNDDGTGDTCVECTTNEQCQDSGYTFCNQTTNQCSYQLLPPCFTGDTLITMANDLKKPIKDVRVGDELLSYDLEKKMLVKTTVLKLIIHDNAKKLLVINGDLEVTPEHPVYSNKGWVEVGSLVVGDYLFDKDMNKIRIDSIKQKPNDKLVYNLHVTKPNDYFANGYLVHNKFVVGDDEGQCNPQTGENCDYDTQN